EELDVRPEECGQRLHEPRIAREGQEDVVVRDETLDLAQPCERTGIFRLAALDGGLGLQADTGRPGPGLQDQLFQASQPAGDLVAREQAREGQVARFRVLLLLGRRQPHRFPTSPATYSSFPEPRRPASHGGRRWFWAEFSGGGNRLVEALPLALPPGVEW